MSTPETTATKAATPTHSRMVASHVMLVIFCLSTVLSVPACWLQSEINDTDRYVRTVTPLAYDPAIRTALSNRVTALISGQLEVIVVRGKLIDRDFLVPPLVSLLSDYVDDNVRAFITSDRFPVIWQRINRTAHPAVSALLTGGETGALSAANGQVTLDLGPLIKEIINRLREHRIDIVDRIVADQLDTRFVIFESKALADVQGGVSVLENLAIGLPLVAFVSLVGSLAVSVNRRQTLLWTGLGLAAAMAVCLMLLAFSRWWSVNQLPPGVNRDAATAFFYAIGRDPRDGFRLFSLLGLLMAAMLLVTRPDAWLRRQAWRSVTSSRSGIARWPEIDKVAAWSSGRLPALAIGFGVACCLLVIAVDPLTVAWATAVLIILTLGIVALLLLWARKGEPVVSIDASSRVFPGHGAFVASGNVSTAPAVAAAVFDNDRVDLVALAAELSTDDVRVLRRLAVVLRNSK